MAATKFNTLHVRLPEGVVFALPLAGPVTRFVAWLVDLVVTVTIVKLITQLLFPLVLVDEDVGAALQTLVFFAVPILYSMVLEWLWRGQTLGKRVLRLRVMDAGGLRLRLHQVIIRNLLRAVDMLPGFYLVGGMTCVLNRRSQRLGDLAADTVVVRTRQPAAPDLTQLMAGKYNSLRDHPALAARLRQRVPPAEAGVALQALLRRDELDAPARVDLFGLLAARFRAAVPLPEELAEGLTDEQYVRNVVDVLFQARLTKAPVVVGKA